MSSKQPSKLLPSDRTALARQRLQEKMEAKQKAKQQQEQQNQTVVEESSSSSSSDTEEKKQEEVPVSPPPIPNTTTTETKKQQQPKEEKEEDLSFLLPKPRSKQNNNNNNVESVSPQKVQEPVVVNSPQQEGNNNSNDVQEDLEAILQDEEDEDENNNNSSSPDDVVDAYDEFNLVEHQNNKQNSSPPSSPQWEDHGRLLSEVQKEEEELLSGSSANQQHFDYFLLIDFECTCDERPGFDNEIIEMPALLYDTKKLKIVAEFHTYIKPLRNPALTPFCNQLTGIRQDQVENAPCYDDALKSLVVWLQETLATLDPKKPNNKRTDGTRLCVATDGPCDLEVFGYLFMHIRDGFAFPNFFQRYLDVKQVFRDEYGEGKYQKIKDMLAKFGLRFQGNQHSGIDDTRNLARIVTQMIRRGTVFNEVYYVTNTSGKRRVPAYIWNRAKQTVKRATERRRIGIGPKLADRCRAGLLGLSDAEVAARGNSVSLISMLQNFALLKIKVRAGEFSNAPSTALIVLMLCVYVASLLM